MSWLCRRRRGRSATRPRAVKVRHALPSQRAQTCAASLGLVLSGSREVACPCGTDTVSGNAESVPHTNQTANSNNNNNNNNTRLKALFPGLPRWAGTRRQNQSGFKWSKETVSGSGISWAICKSAPCSRQITTPALYHSDFYRPDALPAAQPTASKHWSTIRYQMHFNVCSIADKSD